MAIPIIISYSTPNLKNIDRNSEAILKKMSGVHTCRFYYHPEFKRHKRLRISIDGIEWAMIVGFGRDYYNLMNPWFQKEEELNGVNENEAIVEECRIIFASSRKNPIDIFIANNLTSYLSDSKDLITKFSRIKKPIVPIHKEEEKEIWSAYCDGLNALNREKRDFINVTNVMSPISYHDTRMGDIFTLRLDLEKKPLESIPDYINKELGGKFRIKKVDFDDTKENLYIRFRNLEKFAEGDFDNINSYLANFGFLPSKPHVQSLLKASVSFSNIGDRHDKLSLFDENLTSSGIKYYTSSKYSSELLYHLEEESDQAKFEEVAKDILSDEVLVTKISSQTIKLILDDSKYEQVIEELKGLEGCSISKSKITISYTDSISYNKIKNNVQDVLTRYDSQTYIPEYKLAYKLSFIPYKGVRNKHLVKAFDQLSSTKSLASNIEFNQDESRVIRFTFAFKTAEERESIIHTLEDEFKYLGSLFKLTLKERLGFTQLNYNIDSKAINELEENYKLDYQGEEIKLVDGKTYHSLFKDIEDPENIVDPMKRNQYNRFMEECPIIGVCHKMTGEFVVVRLNEDFFNGERMIQPISSGDMIFFPSVGSSTELRRQSEAILRINKPGIKLSNGRQIAPPANAKLCDFLFSPLFARGIKGDIEAMMSNIRGNKLEEELNEKQIEAIAKAVLAEDIAFIQGPPGTGKTTVIAEIIWQEIRRNSNCKILLTSQTNLAVDNALERLKYKKSIRPIRVISEQRINNEDILYNINALDNWVDSPNEYTKGNVVEIWIDEILKKAESSKAYSNELAEWKSFLSEKDKMTRRFFVDKYKENVNLIAATCSLCGSLLFRQVFSKMYNTEDVCFDVVIMDEASKATPLEMAVPMVLGKKIIVIGDHKQLPPLMDEHSIDTALKKIGRNDLATRIEDLKESQFKKLFLMAQKYNPSLVTTLDTQYRMHKDIMQTINQFYVDELGENGLICGIEKEMNNKDTSLRGSRYHGISYEPFISNETHAIWVNVEGEEQRDNTSYKNLEEIKAIKTVMTLLSKADGFWDYIHSRSKIEDKEIGLITFYSAQKREIRKLVNENEIDNNLDYRIDVVDRFQGMERNIVIVSTVRSNKYNKVGFAKEIERINVAFSRARTLLIVIGNRDLFSSNSNYQTSIDVMEHINIKQLEDILKNEY